jgi:hypothetical protein
MYYRYQPYPYYKRYYNINPYHYGRYYSPYYNIIGSQIAYANQRLINYGNMTDVIQNSNIYQLRTPASENVGVCTTPPETIQVEAKTVAVEPTPEDSVSIQPIPII